MASMSSQTLLSKRLQFAACDQVTTACARLPALSTRVAIAPDAARNGAWSPRCARSTKTPRRGSCRWRDFQREREAISGTLRRPFRRVGRYTPKGIEVRKGVNNRQGRTDLLSLKQILQVAKTCFGGDPRPVDWRVQRWLAPLPTVVGNSRSLRRFVQELTTPLSSRGGYASRKALMPPRSAAAGWFGPNSGPTGRPPHPPHRAPPWCPAARPECLRSPVVCLPNLRLSRPHLRRALQTLERVRDAVVRPPAQAIQQ